MESRGLIMSGTLIGDAAALGAAVAWTAGGLLAMPPVRSVGAPAFNRVRLVMVGAILIPVTALTGGLATLDVSLAGVLALSALIGMVAGDTALFIALGRVGPRRNSVVYATNAPLTALMGWLWLDEPLTWWTGAGILLVTLGVIFAVDRPTDDAGKWETVRGRLWVGVALGLFAALCQAGGTIVAAPAMRAGVDPLTAATARIVAAGLALNLIHVLTRGRLGAFRRPLSRRILVLIVLNAIVALGLGVTLMMVGLARGEAGTVAVLSATSPVMMLPALWLLDGRRPAWKGWAGAVLAVVGTAIIMVR